jgi:hypothetical protein
MLLLLNTSEIGYKLNMQNKRRLSHFQLHGETQEKLHSLIDTVIIFSNDIKITLGFDSYAIINIRKDEVRNQQKKYKDFEAMQPEETY